MGEHRRLADRSRNLDDFEPTLTPTKVKGEREQPHRDGPIESKKDVVTAPGGLPDPPRGIDDRHLVGVIGAARRTVANHAPIPTESVAQRIGHPTSVTYAALLKLLEQEDVAVRTTGGTAPSDVPDFQWTERT